MTRSLRLSNVVASTLNAWRGDVRPMGGKSLSNDAGFCAPSLGFGYQQPEHIPTQVHSGRKGS